MYTFTNKTSSNLCLLSSPNEAYSTGPYPGEAKIQIVSIKIFFRILMVTNLSFFFLILKFAASDEHPRQFISMPEDSLQMVLSQVTDQNLKHTLQFGIGLHHAGLNDKDRSLVEELFANNKIQATMSS